MGLHDARWWSRPDLNRRPLLAKQVLCQLSYDPRIGWQLLKKNGGSQNLLCAINWNPDSGTPAFEGGNPFVLRP